MGPTSILVLDVIALAVAVVLHRRYPHDAFADLAVLVVIGALMLALGPTAPALVASSLVWAALVIKATAARGAAPHPYS